MQIINLMCFVNSRQFAKGTFSYMVKFRMMSNLVVIKHNMFKLQQYMLYFYSKHTTCYTIPNLEMQMTLIKMNLFHSLLLFNEKGLQIKNHSIQLHCTVYATYIHNYLLASSV